MLTDLRVLELSSGIAASYCGKLLADAGALVTVLEPVAGHPLRHLQQHPDADAGLLFDYLCHGKQVLQGDPAAPPPAVLGDAVVVVEDMAPGVVERLDLRRDRPGLVVVSVSAFGHGGPWSDRPATDFTLQAWCGSIGRRGLPGRPPVQAGGRVTEWVAGSYAAAAAASFWWGVHHGAEGAHLDLSVLECGVVSLQPYLVVDAWFREGRSPFGSRAPSIPSVEPSADGFVGFSTITAQQFRDFLVMVERPDLADDERLLRPEARLARRDELLEAIHSWTRRHTTAEIVDLATAFRIPVAPIGNGENLPRFPHLVERGVFIEGPRGLPMPRTPYRIGHTASGDAGDATAAADAGEAVPVGVSGGHAAAPLAGLKVVDFTAFWAGPAATHLLACLGADVVKIESVQRPDGMRFVSARPDDERWWEWGAVFHGVNGNKRDVTLNLASPAGLDLARRLVAWGDVVIENFSPRVMDGFGLGWDEVAACNPRAVMVRMPAFGLSGPWRDRTGFAMTVEQASGLAWQTGYEGGPPMDVGGVCDPLGGMHAVVALVAAMAEREHSGRGCLVEVPLMEAALNVTAEQVLQYAATGVLLGRTGNRGEDAPQGVYRCAGDDEEWLALAVVDDEQWARLCKAMGDPLWAQDGALASSEGRRAHVEILDDEIGRWCRGHRRSTALDALHAAGIPAAAVVQPDAVGSNPQLRDRGFFEAVHHPVAGDYEVPSLPFRVVGRARPWIRSSAPVLGQHNADVLQGILGIGEEGLARLHEARVIGDRL